MTNYPDPLYLPQTESTNTFLAGMCKNSPVPNLTSVYTSFQTNGRGQRGNKWESENGANLLFSVAVYPKNLHARQFFIVLQITALAISEVLAEYTEDISIKWPNDIYWKDKKICGTLIENDLNGEMIEKSISGSGINLNQTVFLSDAPNPVSLRLITGHHYNAETILRHVLTNMAKYLDLLENGETNCIKERYMKLIYRRNGFHQYKDRNGFFMAKIKDVKTDGRFVLEDENGNTREYLFKEVEYII